jgi:hypothetical protein
MRLTQLWCGSLLVFFPAIAFAQWPGTGDAYVSNASCSAASGSNATSASLVVQASRPHASLGDPQFVVIAACRWSWRAKTELADRNGKVAERTPRPPIGTGLGCADISTAVTRKASPSLSAHNSAIKRGYVLETT